MPVLNPKEFIIRPMRQCGTEMIKMENPDDAEAYWRKHIQDHPYFSPEVECFIVLLVNTRRRLIGHHLIAVGSLDSVTVHARECFRAAIIGAASAVILMHNHPSGDPTPSDADTKVTRELIRAGQLLKIDVLDHVIIGEPTPERPSGRTSLRELGYFYS
jgi:DNA repair protein RadC